MKVFSVVYRPDIDTYYLYDREGKRILPQGDGTEKKGELSAGWFGFSFHDDYNHPVSVVWAELLEFVELDDGLEYFRQAEMGTGNMQDIISRVTNYWLDRGKADTPALPEMVEWARKNMVDASRHLKQVSTLYTGDAAVAGIETIFARYLDLVKKRDMLNYGHYWPDTERIELMERRFRGEKFINIAKAMGRTNAACRAQYGRIRRGEDDVYVNLEDWDIFREAMPLGVFPKKGVTESEKD